MFIFLIFGFSVINTGCAIYPLSLSCFGDLPWSLSEHQVIKANNHYELWAKGGMAPNFKVENRVGTFVLRWEYNPGSTLFVVYNINENRYYSENDKEWTNSSANALVIKLNYWIKK